MSKSKKKKTKRPKYPHGVPVEYLQAVADQLWRINPSKQIVYNTVLDVWKHGYGGGYVRKGEEICRFKRLKEATFTKEYELFQTYLEDLIADKSGTVKDFEQWFITYNEAQKKIRVYSNNQQDK
jgi:hypothetical protein